MVVSFRELIDVQITLLLVSVLIYCLLSSVFFDPLFIEVVLCSSTTEESSVPSSLELEALKIQFYTQKNRRSFIYLNLTVLTFVVFTNNVKILSSIIPVFNQGYQLTKF